MKFIIMYETMSLLVEKNKLKTQEEVNAFILPYEQRKLPDGKIYFVQKDTIES